MRKIGLLLFIMMLAFGFSFVARAQLETQTAGGEGSDLGGDIETGDWDCCKNRVGGPCQDEAEGTCESCYELVCPDNPIEEPKAPKKKKKKNPKKSSGSLVTTEDNKSVFIMPVGEFRTLIRLFKDASDDEVIEFYIDDGYIKRAKPMMKNK